MNVRVYLAIFWTPQQQQQQQQQEEEQEEEQEPSDTADTTSKSSKFPAAGLNLHGRYLPDQLRVGPGTQHDVMTILRSKSKWRSSPTGIWQMLHSTFRLRTSISTHKRETLKIGQVWPSSNNLKCSNYSRTRYRLGQCRAHLRWLPRTWHQSGFRTGLASEKCGGAPACHNMPATGLKMLQVCQRKKAQETRVHSKKNTPRRETKRLSCKHITRYLTCGLPGRAQAHAWLRGKLKAKGKDFEDAWGLPEDDSFRATSTWLR